MIVIVIVLSQVIVCAGFEGNGVRKHEKVNDLGNLKAVLSL